MGPFSGKKEVIQPKLSINRPGDEYEQEADAMAEKVMRTPANGTDFTPKTGIIGASIQRKCAACEEEEKQKKIMRKETGGLGGSVVSNLFSSTLNSTKGGGTTLPQSTRGFMENAFSTDFTNVRIHNDSQANQMSQSINAKAFTHGNDIYFGAGQYAPNTYSGKSLLAHELTHTMQQGMTIERKIQRKEIFDGRPNGWEDDYEFVLEAANNYYENDLDIDMKKPFNNANQVHSCKVNEIGGFSCKVKNRSNQSDSPEVEVVWYPRKKLVVVIISGCKGEGKGERIFCNYTYKKSKSGFDFKKITCGSIACL